VAARLPADRASFLELQARNRRATWRVGAVCALVVGGGGVLSAVGFVVNFALVLFALVFVPSVALLGLGLVELAPATTALREPLWGAGLFALRGLDLLTGLWPGDRPAVLGVLAVLLPLGGWLAVRSVWLATGVGETPWPWARGPAPDDLEERQLVNVVQEMAIADGIPQPRVRLLDAAVANAAAVGSGSAEGYVVVGRRLLDEFDRDETQSLLGHLIGSIGNGDLRGAAQVHAMLYVLGS
jgi:Zn-dependent protease with chaperone function